MPPVDADRAAQRALLAKQLDLDGEFGAGFNAAYVKGGPLWLYYGNREYVVGLPDSVLRRKLGDDAAQPRYITTVRGVGFRFDADQA